MNSVKQILKKAGGIELLKQYWRGGAFFTSVFEMLILGKSRTALEILRLSAQMKIKQKLAKKYKFVLNRFEDSFDCSLEHRKSDKVWICWFQGIENAPLLVQKCYKSVVSNMPDKEVILITSENMERYVQFPNFIIDKWKKGYITHTHMTDLLRLELLIKYGGMWLDATVFCSDCNIPSYFFDSDLFFYQCLKPGKDGHANYVSSWLISAKTNNKVLMAVRELCYTYWTKNKKMCDYFLLHDFMSIVLDRYQDELKAIPPRDNATPHILLLRFFEQYDESIWNCIKSQTPFHKLSYKFEEEKTQVKDTYYDVIINKGEV